MIIIIIYIYIYLDQDKNRNSNYYENEIGYDANRDSNYQNKNKHCNNYSFNDEDNFSRFKNIYASPQNVSQSKNQTKQVVHDNYQQQFHQSSRKKKKTNHKTSRNKPKVSTSRNKGKVSYSDDDDQYQPPEYHALQTSNSKVIPKRYSERLSKYKKKQKDETKDEEVTLYQIEEMVYKEKLEYLNV